MLNPPAQSPKAPSPSLVFGFPTDLFRLLYSPAALRLYWDTWDQVLSRFSRGAFSKRLSGCRKRRSKPSLLRHVVTPRLFFSFKNLSVLSGYNPFLLRKQASSDPGPRTAWMAISFTLFCPTWGGLPYLNEMPPAKFTLSVFFAFSRAVAEKPFGSWLVLRARVGFSSMLPPMLVIYS